MENIQQILQENALLKAQIHLKDNRLFEKDEQLSLKDEQLSLKD